MKKTDYDNYESLDQMARDLPYSRERSLLREKALTLADTLNDEEKQFDARMNYVNDVCMEGGFPEKYLSVFPWLLAYVSKSKFKTEIYTVLWYYKWVVNIMPEFPSISISQIENALLDLQKRYREFGTNDKMFHFYSRAVYCDIGDYEKSAWHHKKLMRYTRSTQLDDCEACVLNRGVKYHIAMNNFEQALKEAQPLLTGKKTCTHVPKATYSALIIPLLIRNDHQRASEFSEKIEKDIKGKKFSDNYEYIYPVIINHTVQGRTTNAIKLFEKNFGNAFMAKAAEAKFCFYVSAIVMFKKVQKKTIRLKLPPDFPLYNKESTYDVKEMTEWLEKETEHIASLFNNRNGNDKYTKEKRKILSI